MGNNRIDKETMRFQRARKIPLDSKEAMGMKVFYLEDYKCDDGYIYDIDSFIELCENDRFVEQKIEKNQKPKYVYGTYIEARLRIDAMNVLEDACCELHADALDSICGEDIDSLQNYLDQWCSEQKGTDSYCPDFNVAIMLPKAFLVDTSPSRNDPYYKCIYEECRTPEGKCPILNMDDYETDCEWVKKCVNMLKAYEDTGLTPEQINKLKVEEV